GLVMKESFDQHEAQRPRPATGSWQAAHNGGNPISSTRRKAARGAPAARLNGAGRANSDNIRRHPSAAGPERHRPPRLPSYLHKQPHIGSACPWIEALGDIVRLK